MVASFQITESPQSHRKAKKNLKGWTPKLIIDGKAEDYWNTLDNRLHYHENPNLKDISGIIYESAKICMKPSHSFRRPEKSPELLSLLRQRRQEQNRDQRTNLSRQIQRVARRELRAWRSLWANHLLDQYRNIKFLQRINTGPI